MKKILVMILMAVALVGLVFSPASTVLAASGARSLPTSVAAGANLDVTIDTADYGAFGQVVETLPPGFSYVGSTLSAAAVTVDGEVVKFTLLGETTFTYTVKASSSAGTHTFSGILKDEDKVEHTIAGQDQIIVSAIRSLPPSADTDANFDVSISTADYGAFGQVVETLPAGFSYVGSTLSAAAVTVDGEVVKFTLLGETTFTYTVKASSSGGTHTFSGILRDEDKVSYTVGGDVQLTVTAPYVPPYTPAAPTAFSVSNLSIEPTEIEPEELVTITVSVANTGGTRGSYTVVLEINGVEEDEERVTIAAGGSQTVSFSATREEAGTYAVIVDGLSGSFTVVAPVIVTPPPRAVFSVSNLSIEFESEESVTITVSVANTGGKSGSYTVVLKIDSVKEAEERVTIAAGGSQTVSFSVTREEVGTYAVSVAGLSGSFGVMRPLVVPPDEPVEVPDEVTVTELEPAAFSTSNFSVRPAEVEPDREATVKLLVANTGGTEGSYTVVLKIDGVKEAEETVTVAAGSSRTVRFSVTREEAGSYAVEVDGLSGTFTVVKPPGFNWPMFAWIIGAVIVVGLVATFVIRRYRA